MSDFNPNFSLDFDLQLALGSKTDRRVVNILTVLAESKKDEAVTLISDLRNSDGGTPLVRHLLALALCRFERVVPAIRLLESAHKDAPECFEHVEVLAALWAVVGNRSESLFYAKLATALKPAYPQYALIPKWLSRFGFMVMVAEENPVVDNAMLLLADGALERASEQLIDALDLNQNDVRAWSGLVEVNQLRNRPGDSLRAAEALHELDGENPEVALKLARCHLAVGDVAEAWAHVHRSLDLSGGDINIAQVLPGMVRYDPDADPGMARLLSDAWNDLASVTPDHVVVTQRPSDDARFRVGVLSGGIHAGSEQAGILSTIEECIGRAADLYYYSNLAREDAVSRRMRRSAMRWRDISRMDDVTVAAMMRNDEIQVLIDLDGYRWSGRPRIVAQHPAPVVLCAYAEPGAVPGVGAGVLALGEPGLPGYEEGEIEDQSGVVVQAGLATWPLYSESSDRGSRQPVGAHEPARILIDAPAERLSSLFLSDLAQAVRAGLVGTLTLRGDDPDDSVTTDILTQRFLDAGFDISTVRRVPSNTPLEQLVDQSDLALNTYPLPSVELAFVALRRGVPMLSRRPNRPDNGAVASLMRAVGLDSWIEPDAESFARRLASVSSDVASLRDHRAVIQQAVRQAGTVEDRNKRGREFADMFDRLLAAAAAAGGEK